MLRLPIVAAALCLTVSLVSATARAAEPARDFAGFRGWGAGPIEMVLVPKARPVAGTVPTAATIVPASLKNTGQVVVDARPN